MQRDSRQNTSQPEAIKNRTLGKKISLKYSWNEESNLAYFSKNTVMAVMKSSLLLMVRKKTNTKRQGMKHGQITLSIMHV